MAQINMTLQGKGGVGKSFVSSLLAQYFSCSGCETANFDTDPVNATFHAYESLNVRLVQIMEGDSINPIFFDELMENLLTLPDNVQAVVDNGASTFIPLGSYMAENDIPNFLRENGHTLNIHSVITGGQAEADTFKGLESLLDAFSSITVWINPFFGHTDFLQSDLYEANKEKIQAVIGIPAYNTSTFGTDLKKMLSARVTFDEAIADSSFSIMSRQRLKKAQREIFELMAEVEL